MASLKPKILFYDIETRPMVAEVWGLYDQNIGLNQVRQFGGVLCFAAKWYGKAPVYFHSEWGDGLDAMLEAMHKLWSEADAVCGYNNDRFDNKKMRWQFIKNGMEPPPPVASIDLYKTVSQQFGPDSKKLDHVAAELGVGSKLEHEGHALWTRCLNGDEKALRTMERYNKQDVRLTEKVYKKLRPYIKNHPHLGIGNSDACPACGSLNVQKRGHAFTRCYEVQRLQCTDCAHWYQGKRTKRAVRDVV